MASAEASDQFGDMASSTREDLESVRARHKTGGIITSLRNMRRNLFDQYRAAVVIGALSEMDWWCGGGLLLGAISVLHSDYDHGMGLSANEAVLALVPVLHALAVFRHEFHIVEALGKLGCAVPD
ncbi:MAG: hypothetical protein ACK55I_35350, partial [bacterium]